MLDVSYVAFIICRSRATVQLPGFAKYVVCCIQVFRDAHVPGVVIGIRVRYVSTLALYATIFTKAIVPASGVAIANCVAIVTMNLYHVPVLDVTCCILAKTVQPLNHGALIWRVKVWICSLVGVVSFAVSVMVACAVHALNVISNTKGTDALGPVLPNRGFHAPGVTFGTVLTFVHVTNDGIRIVGQCRCPQRHCIAEQL
jgi:hypothetical protein